jgi:hypothetical protein
VAGDQYTLGHIADAMNISMRQLLALRPRLADQTLLDYIWCCSQPMVSRRLAALKAAGLVDVTRGAGGYHIQHVTTLDPLHQ